MKAIWSLHDVLTMLIRESRKQGVLHLCFTMWNTEISLTQEGAVESRPLPLSSGMGNLRFTTSQKID